MRTFSLFIEGQDISSDLFDYGLDAKHLIQNPRRSLKTLSSLRKGIEISPEEEKTVLGKFYLAKEQHVEKAIASSFSAFNEFKKFSTDVRADILDDIRNNLILRKDDFMTLLMGEGHPYRLAVWQYENMVEGLSKENIKYFKSLIRSEFKTRGEKIIITKKPDGVILVIPPRNAAASNSFVAISALLNGSTLIIKPPQKTPISTIFLWREIVHKSLKKHKCPEGTINIIQGNSSTILDRCLESEKISSVFIFGESKHGIELGKKVYAKGKKPILELSGNDISVIWKDAKLNDALLSSSLEAFLGSTQICMVPKILVAHPKIYRKYVELLKSGLKTVKAGLPDDKGVWLSPVGKMRDYDLFLEDALSKGAKMVSGGKKINYMGELDESGLFVEPTLLEIESMDDFRKMLCYNQEIFFPLIPIVKAGKDDLDDSKIADRCIDLINGSSFGLRCSLWVKDRSVIKRMCHEINNVGSIRVNSRHIGFSRYMSTHGGTNNSGGQLGELNYMCLRAGHLQGISIKDG